MFKKISYLSVQKNNNDRLAAVNKSSPAIVFFLPSLSINSIVNSIPEKLPRVKWPVSKCLHTNGRKLLGRGSNYTLVLYKGGCLQASKRWLHMDVKPQKI